MKYIMNIFHQLTIGISVFIFIAVFTYCAVIFYRSKSTLFPPDMAPCPDNWKMNMDGTCKIPAPGKNANLGYLEQTGRKLYVYSNLSGDPKYSYLASYYDTNTEKKVAGKPNPRLPLGYYTSDIPYGYDIQHPEKGSIDFTDMGWASYGDPYCAIKKWAKTQNIQWDGLASYNNHCVGDT
jgi:hypothetical protein